MRRLLKVRWAGRNGEWEASSLGFRIGITIASFHKQGKVEHSRMRLRREVRYEIAFEWRLRRKMVGIGS